ncbi:MAG TPA: DUF488 domain-containing protein [Gemmataceae bacterium]
MIFDAADGMALALMVCAGATCYDAVIMDVPPAEKQMRSGTAPPEAEVRLVSVGHSNHDWPAFVALLRGAGVTAVADVRSSPYSGRCPYFNRGALEGGLREHGIAYLFLGDLLGGRPASPALYDEAGRVDYERVRETAEFQCGLERLTRDLLGGKVAFLCSEEDPLDCHRGLMIAPALVERGYAPSHLRRDGSLETNEEMEDRLLRETKVGDGIVDGLFASLLSAEERRALVAEAYRHMARRKAYQLPQE